MVPKQGAKAVKTQLGGDPSKVQLNSDEKALIEKFNINISNVPYRLLLLSTQALLGLISDYNNIIRCAEKIMLKLKEDGFSLEMTKQALIEKILVDALNQDVPYFTKSRDALYNGRLEEGLLIAKEK